jgi:hypothetical protein
MISVAMVALLGIPLIRWLLFRSGKNMAKHKGKYLVFSASNAVEALFSLSIVAFSGATFWSVLHHEEWWVSAGFFGFVLLAVIGWPATIMISDVGVFAERLIWRTIFISWSELHTVEKYNNPLTFVLADGRNKISYTSLHADAVRFEAELRTHFRGDFTQCKHPHSE